MNLVKHFVSRSPTTVTLTLNRINFIVVFDMAEVILEHATLTAEIHEHAVLTAAIKSGKKCDSTKEQYKRKQNHFEDWVQKKRPALIDTDKWLSYFNAATMEDFMGHICHKKSTTGEYLAPPQFQSYDHVNGYKSAILDLYERQKVKPSVEIKMMFIDFANGYKRKIASLKQYGEIKITEGKAI